MSETKRTSEKRTSKRKDSLLYPALHVLALVVGASHFVILAALIDLHGE
jgi:hypothetical protein